MRAKTTAFLSWGLCTSKCELAQCGDGKIEPPESCECLTGWSLKAAQDDAQEKFTTLCPSSLPAPMEASWLLAGLFIKMFGDYAAGVVYESSQE